MALSQTASAAMHAAATEHSLITLMTIMDSNGAVVGRVSDAATTRLSIDPLAYATGSRNQWYYYVPFAFVRPGADETSAPVAQVIVDNTDRQLIAMIRSTQTPPRFLFEMVLDSSLDIPEIIVANLSLQGCSYDASQITLSMGYQNLMDEPFPHASFTPNFFPNLFR